MDDASCMAKVHGSWGSEDILALQRVWVIVGEDNGGRRVSHGGLVGCIVT